MSWYQPPHISDQELAKFPQFAVSAWFWQAILLVITLGSFNPATLGNEMWGIPTIRELIQVLITREWKTLEQRMDEEIALQKAEIPQILALETILAQGSNTLST